MTIEISARFMSIFNSELKWKRSWAEPSRAEPSRAELKILQLSYGSSQLGSDSSLVPTSKNKEESLKEHLFVEK